MNREEQEQFSWVRMSHFNDPRDDASHIICNYDGIDLVRGARRRSAKLDFEKFGVLFGLLSSWNCGPGDALWHEKFHPSPAASVPVSRNLYLKDSDVSHWCFFFFCANHRGCWAMTIWAGAPFRARPSQSCPGIRIQPVNAPTGPNAWCGRVARDTWPP